MVGTIDAVSSNNVRVTPSTRTKNKKHVNEDGEEWKNSKQKKDIIAAFLDDESGIHICHLHKYLIHTQTVLGGRGRMQWQTFED